jgi:protoporphyrin/coproporphyrin ferrochelatase
MNFHFSRANAVSSPNRFESVFPALILNQQAPYVHDKPNEFHIRKHQQIDIASEANKGWKMKTPIQNQQPILPPGHPPILPGKVGVLLVNLGTPEATSYWPMRRYLKEFLSDPRVIETNRTIWWLILNLIILTFRPTKSGHAYEKIWNNERNESPLKTITREQSKGLAHALGEDIHVDWAMNYGLPPISERLQALQQKGCDRILVFPLYPQYSAATTASVMDKLGTAMAQIRWQPTIRVVPPYFATTSYIDAIAGSLSDYLKNLSWKPDRILMAFHGLPKEYLDKGDPYHCHCQKTARLVRNKLGLSADFLQLVFQSRFGRAEWLKPYAQDTVEELPSQGVKNLLIISPGFAADCVETLEELSIGLKETFEEKGGENFAVVPCLNASPASLKMLETIVRTELKGWL